MNPSLTRPLSRSLVTRVALGATASAVLASLAAAIVTSVFTSYLVRQADDQRLLDAAGVLANELRALPLRSQFDDPFIQSLVRDELRETNHTGLTFAVFRDGGSRRIAGDGQLTAIPVGTCRRVADLRACCLAGPGGAWVMAAAPRPQLTGWLALAAALAALIAGIGAWLGGGPVADWLIAPLSELRARVGAIDHADPPSSSLGPSSGIMEVDALRDAILGLLVRMQDSLDRAERFAADAAHELRTPLTAIRGELELLVEDESLPDNALLDLTRARNKVIELQRLTERLLVLALPNRSGWSASELVSIPELAEDAVTELPAPDRARVSLEDSRGDLAVRGDSALLGILLSNALSNGLKFGSRVWIRIFEDGSQVVVQVDDDGPGVATEDREQVFEAFVRSPRARQQQVPGHGLGLALIAHVARRHGGSARFSDGATGARLEIHLPRAATNKPETPSAVPL